MVKRWLRFTEGTPLLFRRQSSTTFGYSSKQGYEAAKLLTATGNQTDVEAYPHFLWWAIDKNDVTYFNEKAKAKDWPTLKARYPKY